MNPEATSEYPPGTFGRALDDFDTAVERLPWTVRWFWRRRARKARQHFEEVRDRSLREVMPGLFGEEPRWADEPFAPAPEGEN